MLQIRAWRCHEWLMNVRLTVTLYKRFLSLTRDRTRNRLITGHETMAGLIPVWGLEIIFSEVKAWRMFVWHSDIIHGGFLRSRSPRAMLSSYTKVYTLGFVKNISLLLVKKLHEDSGPRASLHCQKFSSLSLLILLINMYYITCVDSKQPRSRQIVMQLQVLLTIGEQKDFKSKVLRKQMTQHRMYETDYIS